MDITTEGTDQKEGARSDGGPAKSKSLTRSQSSETLAFEAQWTGTVKVVETSTMKKLNLPGLWVAFDDPTGTDAPEPLEPGIVVGVLIQVDGRSPISPALMATHAPNAQATGVQGEILILDWPKGNSSVLRPSTVSFRELRVKPGSKIGVQRVQNIRELIIYKGVGFPEAKYVSMVGNSISQDIYMFGRTLKGSEHEKKWRPEPADAINPCSRPKPAKEAQPPPPKQDRQKATDPSAETGGGKHRQPPQLPSPRTPLPPMVVLTPRASTGTTPPRATGLPPLPPFPLTPTPPVPPKRKRRKTG